MVGALENGTQSIKGMVMNQEQAKSAVRWLIATFGPLIIAHGYATSGTLELIGGAVISLIPLAWGVLVHTEANTVAVVDTIAKDPNRSEERRVGKECRSRW